MVELRDIRALYEDYIAAVVELERNRKPLAGIFGFGGGPKDDPCHDRFVEELTALLRDFAGQEPDSAQIRSVLEYIYAAPQENREPAAAYWMLIAVHGLTLELIDGLTPEDAAALYSAYAGGCPRWKRMPVQTKLLEALALISNKTK